MDLTQSLIKKLLVFLLIGSTSGAAFYGGSKIVQKVYQTYIQRETIEKVENRIVEKKINPQETGAVLGEQIQKRLEELQALRYWQKNANVLSPLSANWSVVIGTVNTNPVFKLQVEGDTGPAEDNAYNLGSKDIQWKEIYGRKIFQNGEQVISKVNAGKGISASVSSGVLNLEGKFAGGGCITTNSKGELEIKADCIDFDKLADKMNLDDDTNVNLNDKVFSFGDAESAFHQFLPNKDVVFDKDDFTFYLDSFNNRVGIGTNNPNYKLDVRGIIYSNTAVYAPVFYDSDNTAYYVDPEKTSYLSDVRANIFYDRQNANYYVDPAGTSNLYHLKPAKIIDPDDSAFYIDPSSQSVFNRIDAQVFYDANDTSYYLDPATISYLNDLRINVIFDKQDTSYYIRPSLVSQFNEIRAKVIYDRDNLSYYLDPSGSSVVNNLTVNGTTTFNGNINGDITVTGKVTADAFYDRNNTTYYVDPNSTSIFNDLRADIFYDRNNTTFYVNPAGVSQLNDLRTNILYDRANVNYYLDPAGTSNLYQLKAGKIIDPDDANFYIDPSSKSVFSRVDSQVFYDLDDSNYYVDPAGTSIMSNLRADIFYDRNNSAYYVNPAGVSQLNDLRANIFYDRQNVNYYVDPAGTSNLYQTKIAKIIDPDNSAFYIDPSTRSIFKRVDAEIFYDSDDTNYYIDPDTTSYFRDLRADVFYDRNNSAYYINPAGISYVNDLRANVIYDRQDVSFYLDPASNSVLNNLTIDGDLTLNGNVNGDMTVLGSVDADVFYDLSNPAYYLDPAGTSVVNNFQADVIYDAGNTAYYLDPAGISYMSDLRTNILYDRQNLSFYVDPAGTSVLFGLQVSGDLSVEDDSVQFTSLTGTNFDVYGNFTINLHQFFLDTISGNVGINTTSPTEKLTVQGDIRGTDGTNTKYLLMGGDSPTTGGQLKLYDESGVLQVWLRTTGNSYVNYGKFGVATKSPSQTLQVGEAGDGTSAVANAWNTFSDIRFKENIKKIDNSLEKVLSLKGVYFNWKTTGKRSIGFIAQDVQQVLPEIVQADSRGYLSVSYSKLTPVLVEAVKAQQGLIKENTLRIDKLDLNVFGEIQKVKVDLQTLSSKNSASQKPKKENKNALLKAFSFKDKIIEIAKTFVFKAQAIFKAPVKFLSKVVFVGRVEYEDKDLAGYAKIVKGSKEVRVKFIRAFSFTPVITASAVNSPVKFFIKDLSSTGFTIALEETAQKDYEFSWIAMPVKGARQVSQPSTPKVESNENNSPSEKKENSFENKTVSTSQTTSPSASSDKTSITPTPTSKPKPTAVLTPTPVLEPSPTPTATPSPTLAPTISPELSPTPVSTNSANL